MSRGLGRRQRQVVDALATNRYRYPLTLTELARRIYANEELTRSQRETIRQAIDGLEKLKIVENTKKFWAGECLWKLAHGHSRRAIVQFPTPRRNR